MNDNQADAPSLFRRFRSYIVIGVVAIVAIVALVLTSGDGDEDPETVDPGDETPVDTEPVVEDPVEDPPVDDPPVDDPPAEPSYPGIGTDAALENPNCDPETGRIRVIGDGHPPCVVEWPAGADNGGETSMGVTADSIVMVVRVDPGQTDIIDDVAITPKAWRDMGDIYNQHYEFWGRELVFEFIESSGTDEVAQRADATRAVNEYAPFIVHDATTDGTGRGIFQAEMAARGVIVWASNASWQETQDQPGFRWSTTADDRVTMLHVSEYIGKRVAGRDVQWAGDESLNGQARQIGLIYTDRWDIGFIEEQAAANGFEIVEAVSYDVLADSTQRQERANIIAARMKDAGVTTVIAGTDNLFTGTMTRAATDQEWFPEWIVTGYSGQDAAFFSRGYDQDQWQNAFGPGPIGTPPVNSVSAASRLSEWHHGRDVAGLVSNLAQSALRWPAVCLQLAGPDLTPESFGEGCFAMPPTGGTYTDSITGPGATFGDGLLPWTDYTALDDMAEKWWDPTFERTNANGITQVGAYMVVNGGERYAVGEWTDDDPRVFDPEGAIDRVEDAVSGDPAYEHVAHG
ncbi:MAG: hypothetical protein P8J50_02995 [Acidimicrobiales bacterium]|nr:hypothetical protein [Acidimicrobiales bacterium]